MPRFGHRSLRRSATSAALGLGLLALHAPALAFCRATTCDLKAANPPAECLDNIVVDLCSSRGKPLYWSGGCAWFGVETHGSAKLGVSSSELREIVSQAFAIWAAVDCGGGQHPSISITNTDELYGELECAEPEFNLKAANANGWMFSDSSWPHEDPANALAITMLTANLGSGEIYDADVVLNSFGGQIARAAESGRASLLSVATHEAGHFLGLGHSVVPSAIMYASYSPDRVMLDDDDRQGICSIYPPSPSSACAEPESRFGFSRFCGGINPSTTPHTTNPQSDLSGKSGGCAFTAGKPLENSTATAWPLVGLVLVARRLRRSRSRSAR